jgi:hypothetical protein
MDWVLVHTHPAHEPVQNPPPDKVKIRRRYEVALRYFYQLFKVAAFISGVT